jgi:photosystem II stability/assembly factor-like uncharacterized protein
VTTVLVGCGGTAAPPRAAEPPVAAIRALQLVDSDGGWVLTSSELARATAAGAVGPAITPAGVDASSISAVSFLDERHGWVATTAATRSERGSELAVWRTSDGGSTWRSTTLRASAAAPEVSSFDFVDAAHGFLFTALESLLGAGELYRTGDGGVTWTKASIPLGSRGVSFVTASHGFTAAGGGVERLYESTDAGTSWRERHLAPPPGFSEADVRYGLPAFADERVGVLPVTLFPVDGPPAVAFYRTGDGGRTWTAAAVRNIPEAAGVLGGGVVMPTAIVGPETWLVVANNGGRLYSTADGGRTWRVFAPYGLGQGVETIDFASGLGGWSLIGHGLCQGKDKARADCGYVHEGRWSRDGGETWEPIGG